ncbi:MAG: response regulator transcription factor [Lysobacterales bacterium]
MTEPTRVLLVEDDPATLRALALQVRATDGFELLWATTRYDEALHSLRQPLDLLLVDLDLGEASGIDLIRACRQWQPEVRILVISVLGDERTVIAALEAGADGYLLKDSSGGSFSQSLRTIMAGDAPISPGIARHLLRRFRQPGGQLRAADDTATLLSPRETQMLEALAQGLSYKDVARRLDLSVHTVGDYVKALYRKLRVNSRGEAVGLALRERLLSLEEPPP